MAKDEVDFDATLRAMQDVLVRLIVSSSARLSTANFEQAMSDLFSETDVQQHAVEWREKYRSALSSIQAETRLLAAQIIKERTLD
jgi:hypothetical protein